MYVIVRRDLDTVYVCVQGGHAIAQYALEYPEEMKQWNNRHLIYLGVRFIKEIRDWRNRLLSLNKKCSVFWKPDQDGAFTTLACYDTGEIFKDLSPF